MNPDQLQAFIEFISPAKLQFNWLDILILSVIAFYAVEGVVVGVLVATMDLVSFILSFVVGLSLYRFFGIVLVYLLSIPMSFANAAGFFAASFLSEFFLALFLRLLVYRFSVFSTSSEEADASFSQVLKKVSGAIPSIGSAIVLLSFLLTVAVALPFSPLLKRVIFDSKLGNFLVERTQGFEGKFQEVFGQAAEDTLTFITIHPESESGIKLRFTTSDGKIAPEAENVMLAMVNSERELRGFRSIVMNQSLAQVARSHASDMLSRGYFSHYTPEGLSPFDRLARANIAYGFAGENLALAPDVKLAMRGLMDSEGHRKNILSPSFGQVGIGVIDAGGYGQMFVQVFTD